MEHPVARDSPSSTAPRRRLLSLRVYVSCPLPLPPATVPNGPTPAKERALLWPHPLWEVLGSPSSSASPRAPQCCGSCGPGSRAALGSEAHGAGLLPRAQSRAGPAPTSRASFLPPPALLPSHDGRCPATRPAPRHWAGPPRLRAPHSPGATLPLDKSRPDVQGLALEPVPGHTPGDGWPHHPSLPHPSV
ncbi:Hypothetical predicted protein [Marmota monax]|uniref:Uncharacterized protein n=1 Tax=Marmota monax TaxID=9995 RepID=A0A5E4BW28_MARMO|nr:hypothetical protein GHT09_018158 [Marmota monax]VTJ73466.1 Hypothetical predicted protein [Marmota monax]